MMAKKIKLELEFAEVPEGTDTSQFEEALIDMIRDMIDSSDCHYESPEGGEFTLNIPKIKVIQ